jgi:PBSX family phage terminase large subunit
MNLLKQYQPLLDTDNKYVILKSGRNAGKSHALSQKIMINFFQYDLDILVARCNYGDLEESLYNEVIARLTEEGLIGYVEERKRPLRLLNKNNGNTIYFFGVGGSDLSRSKGIKPKKQCSLFVIDELQQLPRQSNLDQALATFRRRLDPVAQVIFAFNPEPQNAHWCNEYYRINEEEKDFLCIATNYLQIWDLLNEFDRKAIRREKRINPSNYRYLYLGETEGLFGGVYHTFDRDFHLVKNKKVKELIETYGIHSIMIGVDGATTRDKTAFIPTFILNNGQGIVAEYLYHDPERNGQLSDSALMPYVERWIDFLHNKYKLSYSQPFRVIFDSASANLRLTFANHFPSRFLCESYSQKNIIQMARIMQNAFARNVLFILDDGGIFNYMTNRKEYGNHPLVKQLESVIWEDKPNPRMFDPMIPNDATDALTYSTAYYFKNPQALYFNKDPDGLYFDREVIKNE